MVKIWDGPIRLFHWLLVLLIPLLWWTAEENMLDRHIVLGTIMAGLVLFRIIWGLIGSSTARFSSFMRGPRAVISSLKREVPQGIGHNPLGGWSVAAMLFVLALQIGLGLFSSDSDGFHSGSLAHFISFETSKDIAEIHEFLFNVLLGLIGLHIAAILYHAVVKRDDLVRPMLTGRRVLPDGTEGMKPAGRVRLFMAAALSAGLAWWIWNGLALP